MTDKELMQQTLYTLEHFYENGYDREDCFAAITNLLQRLAQPEQEPVAWLYTTHAGDVQAFTLEPPPRLKELCRPLYTTPQRQWQELTPFEISMLWKRHTSEDGPHALPYEDDGLGFARAIEAKLKEKNA